MPIARHHPRIVEIRPTIAFKRIPIMSIHFIDLLQQKHVAAILQNTSTMKEKTM